MEEKEIGEQELHSQMCTWAIQITQEDYHDPVWGRCRNPAPMRFCPSFCSQAEM